MKALISVYNELYCQTTMEYNQLAEFVGVKLDSSHDGNSNIDSVSQLSSAAISSRNRMNLEIRRKAAEEVETTKSDAQRIQEAKAAAAREAEELKRSIELSKAKMKGMPVVQEARASYEASNAANSGRFSNANVNAQGVRVS